MAGNVLINGRSAVHAGSNGTLTTVDICKTPTSSGCIPIPYTNVAKSSDAAQTASSVLVNGNPVCHKDSVFASSKGDESGSCGGLSSGTVSGQASFVTFSSDVFIEGVPAVRQGDMMVSNNKNTAPMPLQQPGAGTASEQEAQEAEELELEEGPYEIAVDVSGVDVEHLRTMIVLEEEDNG